MYSKNRSNQQGFAHIVLIILVIAVVAAVAGVGYYVFSKQKKSSDSSTASASLAKAIEQASQNCEEEDKDICKFFASWKESKEYRVTSTGTSEGVTNVSLYEYEDGGTKTYIKTGTGGDYAYEAITIDKTTYTKNGDVWWKQTIVPADAPDATEDFDYKFEESTTNEPAKKTVYKKIGKEACGNLTCFKYQVINPSATDTTEYIFFDDKSYQLRKNITEGKGSKSEQVFEYSNVNINVPSPVQELGPNQYIMPGESEPVTIPEL